MPTTEILVSLALLIISAKVIGEITSRLGASHILGEIIAGILIGPIFKIIKPDATVNEIASIGMLFIFFVIGTSISYEANKREFKQGILNTAILIIAIAIPSLLYGYFTSNLLNGVIASVIMISISMTMTKDALNVIGQARTQMYKNILTLTNNSKLIGLFLFCIILILINYNYSTLFFVSISVIATSILLYLKTFNFDIDERIKDEYVFLSIAVIIIFSLSYISEYFIGFGVLGAFVAGVLMNKIETTQSKLMPKIRTITYGFFAPVFFAYMFVGTGLNVNFYFLIFMLIISIGSRQLLCYLTKEPLNFGLTFSFIGEMSVVLSYLALSAKYINVQIFSTFIVFIIINNLAVHLIIKFVNKH